jgi:hypothetical protein
MDKTTAPKLPQRGETGDAESIWYGACGVPYCPDCLPRFDSNNNEIIDAHV